MPRSPELYIAILAILKAGGAYIPLDPEYLVDRIEYILADCAVQTIVTTTELASAKAIGVKNIVWIDACESALAVESSARIGADEVLVTERDLSYIIPTPSTLPSNGPDRLYKTGDLGIWTPDGEIQFLGRIDGQVKLRGFRIELSEIESVMMQCAGVSAAVVAVKKVVEIDRLIAYIVPKQAEDVNIAAIWETMRARLPAYMVPGSLEILDNLPTLPSGKVDRKSLPAPQNFGVPISGKIAGRQPSDRTERDITTAWEGTFGTTGISIDDHFFNELGGHSLLAAIMVSKLRETPQFQDLAVLDIYQYPTISQLAAALKTLWAERAIDERSSPPKVRHAPPTQQNGLSTIWASIGIYFLYAIYSMPLLIPSYIFDRLVHSGMERHLAAGISGGSLIALYPALLILTIAIKWLVIGRFKPGKYPLWSNYYWRFWFVHQTQAMIPLSPIVGSPWLNVYCRLMGAKIGRDVYLGSSEFLAYDLLTIGSGSSIGSDSYLLGFEVVDSWLEIGRIQVGKDCYVGTKTVFGLNTQMENGAEIGDLSYLPEDRIIPAGEHWIGSPPAPVRSSPLEVGVQSPRGQQGLLFIGYAIGILAQWVIVSIAAIPGFLL